jgi:pimeloyl-ACP methyl ester carboxylesterase
MGSPPSTGMRGVLLGLVTYACLAWATLLVLPVLLVWWNVVKRPRDTPPSSARSVWTPLVSHAPGLAGDYTVHTIVVPGSGPDVLLVHGTMGSAASSFSRVMGELKTAGYTISAVDLPGFGISTAPPGLRTATSDMTVAFYADFFREYTRHRGLVAPVVVAHSFGSFLAVIAADHTPDLFGRLVLASPVGLLPTLGSFGMYWALFFWLGGPQPVIRAVSRLTTKHPHHSLASRHAYNDRICARFLTMGWFTGRWTTPVIDTIQRLTIPVSIVCGEDDPLCPPHQSRALSDVIPSVTILPRVGHDVMADPELFYRAITREATAPIPHPPLVVEWARYFSSFDPIETMTMIQDLYLVLHRWSDELPETPIKHLGHED